MGRIKAILWPFARLLVLADIIDDHTVIRQITRRDELDLRIPQKGVLGDGGCALIVQKRDTVR